MAERDAELAAALDEQRRAMTLIRGAAAEVRAPLALRERLEADRASARGARAPAAAGSRSRSPAPPPRRCCSRSCSPGRAAPTLEEAAAFARSAARPPAPGARGRRPKLLAVEQDGVAFPEWAEKFGWEATGTHTGEIDGRDATTVYYEKDGQDARLHDRRRRRARRPRRRAHDRRRGHAGQLFRTDDGRPAATWERDGHTCVLSGAGVPDDKLAELAGWKGKGAVASERGRSWQPPSANGSALTEGPGSRRANAPVLGFASDSDVEVDTDVRHAAPIRASVVECRP